MAALLASGDSWDYWRNDTSTRSVMRMLDYPPFEVVGVVAAVLGRLLAEVGLDGTPAES